MGCPPRSVSNRHKTTAKEPNPQGSRRLRLLSLGMSPVCLWGWECPCRCSHTWTECLPVQSPRNHQKMLKRHFFNSILDSNFPAPRCRAARPKPALEQEEGYPLWPLSRLSSSCKDKPDDKKCKSQNSDVESREDQTRICMPVQTLSSLSKRTMRFSWYSVSLSRMMSGSVTVADSSLLLLDWGRLDCLKKGEVDGIRYYQNKEGAAARSEGRRRGTTERDRLLIF